VVLDREAAGFGEPFLIRRIQHGGDVT